MANSFEEILQATDFSEHPLNEALALCRHYVPNTDNLGETQDEFDLYALIERINEAIREAYNIRCHAGCSECCRFPVALFSITPTEWRPIEQFLDQADPVWREALLRRFMENFRPMVMKLIVTQFMLVLPMRIIWLDSNAPECPFLEDGKCSIYPVRPFYCRTFGLYSVTTKTRTHIYACHEQEDHLQPQLDQDGLQLNLPSCNPLLRQVETITRHKDPQKWWDPMPRDKLKEVWLWEYALKQGIGL